MGGQLQLGSNATWVLVAAINGHLVVLPKEVRA
jgi:hypothetical protein